MFDHIEIKVIDLAASKKFYTSALASLGIKVLLDTDGMAGFGTGSVVGGDGKARVEFLLEGGAPTKPLLHIAFKAPSRAAVDAFYNAATAAGGTSNGAAGLRQSYHPSYYAAFVLDPDGHNIEAVFHGQS